MDCLLLFYDAASKDRVMEAAENVKYIVHGVAGTAAVNVYVWGVFWFGFDTFQNAGIIITNASLNKQRMMMINNIVIFLFNFFII